MENVDNTQSNVTGTGSSPSKLIIGSIPIYIFCYIAVATWLLYDGWINNFSSLHCVWGSPNGQFSLPSHVVFSIYTILGAILGSGLLGIISFHRYVAIEKSFDDDHAWGFLFAPLLAAIIGILMFSIIQSGLIVLSGQMSNIENESNATLGYLAIGAITGYNWDVFVRKMQELSSNILNTKP
ncbi:hypothetical protein VCSRO12_0383 [Vibrio cholerae]|uniref:hypothetical protein n=1 Tax=Vibrio cholerae TaxID=666 RepID=UPI0011D87108|nr:hypothetical protein [Vibrio cholerae]EGR4301534.1 hypothetical protein [Vibrio cholerae]TXZ89689.1 hypothetical protein FXE42_14460 [Vibrio cholerae]GHY59117.1 hypothetical protein VCSRO12_0383 [Vibrio cholerae]HCT5076497.1 hypothetical protein [Vibrio cholerae]